MKNSERRIPGSAVVLVDDSIVRPPWQRLRLERVLARFFPEACGLDVVVTVAWGVDSAAWRVRQALVDDRNEGFRDLTRNLRESLAAQGLPVDGHP